MAMTKKDYVLVARLLNDFIHNPNITITLEDRAVLVYDFADALEQANDRFDYRRFTTAALRSTPVVDLDKLVASVYDTLNNGEV